MFKAFIDGREGTTGLRIYDRLAARADVELIVLSEALRKDARARREALNDCDVAFLCLPDAAAVEAVEMVENPDVKIIDTSTAHRTQRGWVYGLPELMGAATVAGAKRVAVPGCHAGGFVALVKPLVDAGILPADADIVCHSLTGYSGGGKKMIAEYEDAERSSLLDAPRQYGLNQQHKHLREMQAMCGLESAPVFCPIVADFYSGMEVTVPLFAKNLKGGADQIRAVYQKTYTGPVIRYVEAMGEGGLISAGGLSGGDGMEVGVLGNEARILLVARFDNLGKGASGAAVQCMNLMMGSPMTAGLELE